MAHSFTKAECQRIDAFELWCWRRLLRVPWTARSNQSILKDISPEYSLEGLMLKLKFQYSEHLMRRTDSLEKTLMLGKIEGRRRGWQRIRRLKVGWHYRLDTHEFEQALGWTGMSGVLQSIGSQRVRHKWVTELNSLLWKLPMASRWALLDFILPVLSSVNSMRRTRQLNVESWVYHLLALWPWGSNSTPLW